MKPKKGSIVKQEKDGNTQKLKNRIKRLEKENNNLRSEINSLEQAFKNTTKFLRDHTEHISLDELINAAKNGSSLKNVQDEQKVEPVCPKCFSKNFIVVPTPFGEVRSCGDCRHRETVNEKK